MKEKNLTQLFTEALDILFEADVMSKKIKYVDSHGKSREITVSTGLGYDKKHPGYKAAIAAVSASKGKSTAKKLVSKKKDTDVTSMFNSKKLSDKIKPKTADTPVEKKEDTPKKIEKVVAVAKREVQKKDKTLGKLNQSYFKEAIKPTDDEMKKDKSVKQIPGVSFDIKKVLPPSFPPKYAAFLNRAMIIQKIDDTTPSLSKMYKDGGAGKISAQAGEVLMMAFSSIQDPKKREALKNQMVETISKYPKGVNGILDKSWVEASMLQAEGLHAKLKYMYPKGYSVEQVSWDTNDDVTALGLSDYKHNKGYSTDVYFRVKTPDGKVTLLEDSLKKDKDVFLLNTAVSEVYNFAIETLDKNDIAKYNELTDKLSDTTLKKKEIDAIKSQMAVFEAKAKKNIPAEINPETFISNQDASGKKLAGILKTALKKDDKFDPKIAESCGIKDKKEQEFLKQSLELSKKYQIGSPEYCKELSKVSGKSIVVGKDGKYNKYLLKSIAYMSNYATKKYSGNKQLAEQFTQHMALAGKFNKAFLNGVVSNDKFKTGLMKKIDSNFPLRAFFEGDEQADIGSVPIFKDVLQKAFGTTNYDDVKENLSIVTNEKGEQELVYFAKGKSIIPLSKIVIRQKGRGYEPNIALEMELHPKFIEQISKTCDSMGIHTPDIDKEMKKLSKTPKTTK